MSLPRAMTAMLALSACWNPGADLTDLDFTDIPYENENMSTIDVVISAFDTESGLPRRL